MDETKQLEYNTNKLVNMVRTLMHIPGPYGRYANALTIIAEEMPRMKGCTKSGEILLLLMHYLRENNRDFIESYSDSITNKNPLLP